jgi:O-antigen ligase
MDRERLDTALERVILALVLGALCFGPLANGASDPVPFIVVQYLILAAALVWVVRLWLKPRPQLLLPPVAWAVLGFTGYAVWRYWGADIEYVARLELVRIVVYAVAFFLILQNLHRQETVNLIGYTLVFLAMAVAFYAGYQFFTGDYRVWWLPGKYAGRGTGTYINPNHLAGFLELILPLGLAYTIAGRMKPVLRILLGYATCVITVGLAVSLSRGAWVATGGALFLFFGILLFHRGYRLAAVLALLVMVAGAFIVVPKADVLRQRAARAVEEMRGPEYSRYLLWGPALDLWRESPWVGTGPGHFDYRFRSVRPQEIQLRPDRAHNDYINTLVDWGVLGLGLVLGTLALLAALLAGAWRHLGGAAADLGHRRSNRFAFVLGGATGLVALVLHSFVDFNMHIPANALLAVALLALLTAHLRFGTERWWINSPRLLTATLTLLVAGAVAFLGVTFRGQAVEQWWFAEARRLPLYSAVQAAYLEAAFEAEPKNFETAARVGECYRIQSWEGGFDYRELAGEAIRWFERATQLNRFDDYSFLRLGMCLDWVGRRGESWPYYARAEELDPNGYYTVAHVGWHFVQQENYAAARPWFERSLRLQWKHNPIAATYLEICNRRLLEAASGSGPAELRLPTR